MAVLITGATGRIGRVLTGSLVDAGMRVHVLTRRPHRIMEYFGDRVTGFEWHPLNEPVPEGALDDIDTIVHLMGDPLTGKATAAKLQRLTRSRVNSTVRLAEAAGGRPIRLIMASSAGIYPPISPSPQRASSPTVKGDEVPHSTPSIAALENAPVAEALAPLQRVIAKWEASADPFRATGGSVICVRLGQVISHDGFPQHLAKLRARRLGVLLDPADTIPAIALADAVALFAWLIVRREVSGSLNAVAPMPLCGLAVNEALAVTGAVQYRISVPQWMLPRLLGLESDLITRRPILEPKRLVDEGFEFACPDPREALLKACKVQASALGHAPAQRLPFIGKRRKKRSGGGNSHK